MFDPRFQNLLNEAIDAHKRGKLDRAAECLAEARVLLEMDQRFEPKSAAWAAVA